VNVNWRWAFSALLIGQPAALFAQEDRCAGIDDPSARLACYDSRSGRAARPAAVPAPRPASPPSATSPATANAYLDQRDALKSRTDFESRLKTVVPLRHGYFRLELADGTSYDTTTVAPPPAVGDLIHVRRTPFGTTFFDIDGRKPFTVRLSRRQ
jgi:hypothetical protein